LTKQEELRGYCLCRSEDRKRLPPLAGGKKDQGNGSPSSNEPQIIMYYLALDAYQLTEAGRRMNVGVGL